MPAPLGATEFSPGRKPRVERSPPPPVIPPPPARRGRAALGSHGSLAVGYFLAPLTSLCENSASLSFRGAAGDDESRTALKMVVPKAPWSAVAPATAFWLGFQGGSSAAALQGASRVFMGSGCPSADGHERLP